MASQARTQWQAFKDANIKKQHPDLYKAFSKGLGPAFDAYESAALKKIKKGMSDADAQKAVASEQAKVISIIKQYVPLAQKAHVPLTSALDLNSMDRYFHRFPMAVAMEKDAKSSHLWAGWPK